MCNIDSVKPFILLKILELMSLDMQDTGDVLPVCVCLRKRKERRDTIKGETVGESDRLRNPVKLFCLFVCAVDTPGVALGSISVRW